MIASTYVLVSAQRLGDIARGKLVQLFVVAEDDDGDIDGTEHRQFVGLLEETAFALEEGAARLVSHTWQRVW